MSGKVSVSKEELLLSVAQEAQRLVRGEAEARRNDTREMWISLLIVGVFLVVLLCGFVASRWAGR
jgi:hypothetical protein